MECTLNRLFGIFLNYVTLESLGSQLHQVGGARRVTISCEKAPGFRKKTSAVLDLTILSLRIRNTSDQARRNETVVITRF